MESNSTYKDRALESLNGKWQQGIVATLIYLAITAVGSNLLTNMFPGTGGYSASVIISILCLPLSWAFAVYFLNLIRNEELNYDQLFAPYKNGEWQRIGGTKLLMDVYIILWMLLLIIPGIVKFYSYAMTDYILRDDPNISYNAAIEKSMQMMEGKKMDLFLLHLSFIGWLLLACLTLGLGMLLLYPYMQSTEAHFYEDLKRESTYENGFDKFRS